MVTVHIKHGLNFTDVIDVTGLCTGNSQSFIRSISDRFHSQYIAYMTQYDMHDISKRECYCYGRLVHSALTVSTEAPPTYCQSKESCFEPGIGKKYSTRDKV